MNTITDIEVFDKDYFTKSTQIFLLHDSNGWINIFFHSSDVENYSVDLNFWTVCSLFDCTLL